MLVNAVGNSSKNFRSNPILIRKKETKTKQVYDNIILYSSFDIITFPAPSLKSCI